MSVSERLVAGDNSTEFDAESLDTGDVSVASDETSESAESVGSDEIVSLVDAFVESDDEVEESDVEFLECADEFLDTDDESVEPCAEREADPGVAEAEPGVADVGPGPFDAEFEAPGVESAVAEEV